MGNVTDEACKPAALVIAIRAPARKGGQAGHRICAYNIIDICKKYAVDLLVLCKPDEDLSDMAYFRKLCARVAVRTVSRPVGAFNVLTHPGLPRALAGRMSPAIRRDILAFANKTYALAHLEWTETAGYAPLLRAQNMQIFCHDIISEVAERQEATAGPLLRLLKRRAVRNARRFETSALPPMHKVFVLSQADAGDLEEMGVAPEKIRIVAPIFYPVPARLRDGTHRPLNLLFWGAFSRQENREAAQFLCSRILPLLPEGDFRVTLAGSESDKYFEASDRVSVTGFVPDVADVFADADLGVYPLFHGSGMKVKVIEALHAGLPVVTTSVGQEGISCREDQGLMLAETAEDFARTIRRLAAAPGEFRGLSEASSAWARQYAEQSVSCVV